MTARRKTTELPVAQTSPPGRARSEKALPKSEYILSLERGLTVIKCFGEARPALTLSEVAFQTGLTRAAARRFLLTLRELGYVESDGRYFSLRAQTLELGYAYLASLPWWRYAQRVADRVAGELGSACAVGVLDKGSVVYVAYASAARFSVFNRSIGTKLPAYATAIGRVLLAGLPSVDRQKSLSATRLQRTTPFTVNDPRKLREILEQVQEAGYSIVNQELEIGLSSAGVPIFDRGGNVVAGMSVSSLVAGLKNEDLKRKFIRPLREASAEITETLPT
jgi:IclR family transcriptional regulator, pca regulon regulatory protein